MSHEAIPDDGGKMQQDQRKNGIFAQLVPAGEAIDEAIGETEKELLS